MKTLVCLLVLISATAFAQSPTSNVPADIAYFQRLSMGKVRLYAVRHQAAAERVHTLDVPAARDELAAFYPNPAAGPIAAGLVGQGDVLIAQGVSEIPAADVLLGNADALAAQVDAAYAAGQWQNCITLSIRAGEAYRLAGNAYNAAYGKSQSGCERFHRAIQQKG